MVQTKSQITLAAVEYPCSAFERSAQVEEARAALDASKREIAGLKAELAAKRREGEARGRLPSEENTR